MKRYLCLSLSLILLLSGCAAPAVSESGASAGSSVVAPPAVSVSTPVPGVLPDGDTVIDPPYDFDLAAMVPRDFGDYFAQDYEGTTVTTYELGAGTQLSNTVTCLQAQTPGETIYIIAGVHGDEEAAWQTGELLKKISLKAGTLYILAPANRWGAASDPKTRFVSGEEDLNRSFPGDPNGTPGQQVAASIYADVSAVAPAFVFDLHEARLIQSAKDFLGSSLIFTDMTGMEDMFFNMILDTESGALGSEPFKYYSPGPAGSVNSTITTELKIPTITVETFRGYPMERRIGDQLDMVQYVLRHYGLVD